MANGAAEQTVCCLCGDPIPTDPPDDGNALSMDHVPPKQFYPKEVRTSQNLNLWSVPTHKRCNGDYRKDEEYFYHAVFPLVRGGNPTMGQTVHRDLMRRRAKPQTPAMIRSLMKGIATVSDGGIHLPPGILRFDLDAYRIQRVVIKIAQGLFSMDQQRCISAQTCRDIRLCEGEADVPEFYQLSWRGVDSKYVDPGVFSYRHCEFDNLHLFSMLFWEAFLFCLAFEDPKAIASQGIQQ